MTPEKFERLRELETKLGPLRDDPRLNTLREIVAEWEKDLLDSLARKLAAGTEIDQRWLDERRGRVRGAKEILEEPHEIERKLQAELAKQTEGD